MIEGTRNQPSVAALLLVAGIVVGCGDSLGVYDPTTILESEVNTAEGAELLRRGALAELFGVADGAAWRSGLLADEFLYEPVPGLANTEDLINRRASEDEQEADFSVSIPYASWQALRSRIAALALEKLRLYARPGAREAHMGEMLAVRAYAALRLAEDYCPGFPLHEVQNGTLVLGAPVSTQEVFEYALAAFDSALTWAADSARVLNFARVGRARTLLQLGRFAEARATVVGVPTAYTYRTEYSATLTPNNELASEPGWPSPTSAWGVARSMADQEGGNGLDFVSAADSRVATRRMGTARDGVTGLYGIGKYPSRATPIVLASGLEARLIEAEAALRAGDPSWLTLLNDLRATQVSPPLPALADPGTDSTRVDLLFRERAFWLFATGTRLGDLRRLMRVYGRSSESVFPTGAYRLGGSYGPATSLLFDRAEQQFGAGRCTGA